MLWEIKSFLNILLLLKLKEISHNAISKLSVKDVNNDNLNDNNKKILFK